MQDSRLIGNEFRLCCEVGKVAVSMFKNTLRAYLEGRETLAGVQRAVAESPNPQQAQKLAEIELAIEWELKNLYASIPPPPHGLTRLKQALAAVYNPHSSAELVELAGLRDSFAEIPSPVGGYPAAIGRLKAKLAAAPMPQLGRQHEPDIRPAFDELAVERKLVQMDSKRRRGVTKKIIGLPRHDGNRDVLAAGKDLDKE